MYSVMITGKVKNKMRTNRQNVNVKFWKHFKLYEYSVVTVQ